MHPDAVSFAEKALAAGAVNNKVRKQLMLDFGVKFKPKHLQNKRQKVKGRL